MEEPAPRMFWPREVWGRYGKSLDAFRHPGARTPAVQCLNHLVSDALRHLPHCLEYMRRLRNPRVFRRVASPPPPRLHASLRARS